jgi:hypothetical protein
MKNETYNGWSNYATWRVMLEIVDNVHYEELGETYESIRELADAIKYDVESYLEDESGGNNQQGHCYDFAMAFVSDVNWYEIAGSMIEDLPQLLKTN